MPETKTKRKFLDQNGLAAYHAYVKQAVSDNKENIQNNKTNIQKVKKDVQNVQNTVDKIPETYVTKQQLHDELYGILETEY